MNARTVYRVLMIGVALALTTPCGRVLAQTNDAKVSAPSATPQVGTHKHRYWRHRGGTHPHFGSRRVRSQVQAPQ